MLSYLVATNIVICIINVAITLFFIKEVKSLKDQNKNHENILMLKSKVELLSFNSDDKEKRVDNLEKVVSAFLINYRDLDKNIH
tara:strand:- start:4394 stop:4645 length:252 start_codon:yes stop_codon:yes gene_type:complete